MVGRVANILDFGVLGRTVAEHAQRTLLWHARSPGRSRVHVYIDVGGCRTHTRPASKTRTVARIV